MPLVVTPGVPRRIPEGINGGAGSLGTEFLLTTIPAYSKASATTLPDRFKGLKSTTIKWHSVLPVTIVKPPFLSSSAKKEAFLTICSPYFLKAYLLLQLKPAKSQPLYYCVVLLEVQGKLPYQFYFPYQCLYSVLFLLP